MLEALLLEVLSQANRKHPVESRANLQQQVESVASRKQAVESAENRRPTRSHQAMPSNVCLKPVPSVDRAVRVATREELDPRVVVVRNEIEKNKL